MTHERMIWCGMTPTKRRTLPLTCGNCGRKRKVRVRKDGDAHRTCAYCGALITLHPFHAQCAALWGMKPQNVVRTIVVYGADPADYYHKYPVYTVTVTPLVTDERGNKCDL